MKDLRTRTAAVKAFYISLGLLAYGLPAFWALALAYFAEMAPNHGVTDARAFMTRWVERFEQTGTVLPAAPLTHYKMPTSVAEQCLEILWAGCTYEVEEGGARVQRHRPFNSIRDAVRNSPALQQALRECGNMSECTLLRALKRVFPGLRRCHLTKKFVHPPHIKAARVQACRKFLAMSPQALHKLLLSTFWIDSKTFYITPSGEWVYLPPGSDLTVADPRLPLSRYHLKKVCYYAVVNAVLGPVYFQYVSGTTDFARDLKAAGKEPYKVSPPTSLFLTCHKRGSM